MNDKFRTQCGLWVLLEVLVKLIHLRRWTCCLSFFCLLCILWRLLKCGLVLRLFLSNKHFKQTVFFYSRESFSPKATEFIKLEPFTPESVKNGWMFQSDYRLCTQKQTKNRERQKPCSQSHVRKIKIDTK